MPPDTPRRFADRYRLEEILGRGGMGEVWRGYDERLNRACAVKVLRIMEDQPSAERFFREARMLASLRDPNVVIIYDYGVDADRPYLVMELLPGPSLSDLVRENGPLSFELVRRYGAQAAYALQAVHDAGVVHRDVKPGNLVLDQAGNARLVDFGIALGGTSGLEATLTEHGAIIGSAAYLAPEQAVGRRADARSDLYGLGCLLMSLLTGKPPFEDDSPVNVLGMHLNDRPPLVSERRPEVPEDIEQLVDDLLAKNPADRPASATEAARRLSGSPVLRPVPPPPMPPRAGEATTVPAGGAHPPPLPPASGRPPKNNAARGALVAAVVVLALAGAVAGWAMTRGGGDDVSDAAPVPSPTSGRNPPKSGAAPAASAQPPVPTMPSVIDVPIPTFANIVTLPPIKQNPKPGPPPPDRKPEPEPEPQPEPEPEPEPQPPAVPTAELEALEKAVSEANVDEAVAPDAKTDLQARVGAIRAAAEGNQPAEAKQKLDEFIAKVGELEGSGALDPEAAKTLRDRAQAVKDGLG